MLGLRHFARLTFALIMALIVSGSLSAGDLVAAEPQWTVTEVSGQANLIDPATGTTPISQGDRVLAGHQVETGHNGRVVMSRGDSRVTISPGSRTELPADAQGGRTTLFQALGAILLKIEKRAEQHFEVQTPYLAAVVKGTTFTVTAGAAQSAVHVVEGAVEVGSFATGDVALVRPGQTATVGAGSNAGVSLLGTPQAAPGQSSERRSEEGGQREDRQAQGAGEGWEPDDGGVAVKPAAAATASTPPQPIARAAQAQAEFAKGVELSRSGQPVLLDRTVGITSLDFSQLTGGLVRGLKPRSQRANLEPGASGDGDRVAAKGKAQRQAKGESTLFKTRAGQPSGAGNKTGRNGVANPGQAIANLVRAAGDPGTPSQSNGRALGRNQNASPSGNQGNGNAFGRTNDSSSPANRTTASNGNSGNNGNGNSGNNGNANSGNSGNANSGNNGNGNSGNSGNGNSGNSGNGNSGNNGNGNSGNNGNGNSGNNGNGNSGNNGNGNSGNNGNGNSGNNGNGNSGNNGNGNSGNNGNGNNK